MSKRFYLISLFAITFCLIAYCNDKGFIVKGSVDGLLAGDRIVIGNYDLPDWKLINSDTITVTDGARFVYRKQTDCTGIYILEYHPAHTRALRNCNRGCEIYVRPGDIIELNGTTEFFTVLHRSGGMYDDQRLTRTLFLEDSINVEMNRIYRRMRYFSEQCNDDSANYYRNIYRNCQSQELRDLQNEFRNTADDSEYAAIEYLMTLWDVSLAEFEERYNNSHPKSKHRFSVVSSNTCLQSSATSSPSIIRPTSPSKPSMATQYISPTTADVIC